MCARERDGDSKMSRKVGRNGGEWIGGKKKGGRGLKRKQQIMPKPKIPPMYNTFISRIYLCLSTILGNVGTM